MPEADLSVGNVAACVAVPPAAARPPRARRPKHHRQYLEQRELYRSIVLANVRRAAGQGVLCYVDLDGQIEYGIEMSVWVRRGSLAVGAERVEKYVTDQWQLNVGQSAETKRMACPLRPGRHKQKPYCADPDERCISRQPCIMQSRDEGLAQSTLYPAFIAITMTP